ncbi:MAG TPA: integrin alpha, partial [Candidatus Limnocylindrales bacterium]|nr:integrin alpha [Candidatus Limnocylindrales bacterium]
MRQIRCSAPIRNRRLLLAVVGIILVRPHAPACSEGLVRSSVSGDRARSFPGIVEARGTQNILDGIRRSEYRFTTTASGALWAPNRSQGIVSRATETGLHLSPRAEMTRIGSSDRSGSWEVGLRLDRFGREGALSPVPVAAPAAEGEKVAFHHDTLTEWYVNGSGGIEQGFTIERRPAEPGPSIGSGRRTPKPGPTRPVVLEMALTGTAQAAAGCGAASVFFLSPEGAELLRYADLHAEDATGRPLEAKLTLARGDPPDGGALGDGAPDDAAPRTDRLRIELRDDGAVYPLRVDPLLTTPSWMTESNQATAHLGIAVAAAGDVNGDGFGDVVVSAPWYDANGFTDEGRVFVFHGSATGPGATPDFIADGNQAAGFFGYSVAAAGDVNNDGYGD